MVVYGDTDNGGECYYFEELFTNNTLTSSFQRLLEG